MKGKLTTTPTIFDNLVVGGYDPKKIPAWVSRSDKSPPAQVGEQSQSGALASAGSPAVAEKAEAVKEAPMAEAVDLVRLLPSQPQQPSTAKPTVVQPPQQQSTTELTGERPNIVSIEGEPALQMTDSMGKLNLRWETQEGSTMPPPQRRGV